MFLCNLSLEENSLPLWVAVVKAARVYIWYNFGERSTGREFTKRCVARFLYVTLFENTSFSEFKYNSVWPPGSLRGRDVHNDAGDGFGTDARCGGGREAADLRPRPRRKHLDNSTRSSRNVSAGIVFMTRIWFSYPNRYHKGYFFFINDVNLKYCEVGRSLVCWYTLYVVHMLVYMYTCWHTCTHVDIHVYVYTNICTCTPTSFEWSPFL